MLKVRAVVYQRVYVCTLKPSMVEDMHIGALEHCVGLRAHQGLTGILMQGERAILGLVEGVQEQVQAFLSQAHIEQVWMRKNLMTQNASNTRLYPGLDLRLRRPCAIPELMAFFADLRRSSKQDAIWHADSTTLAQWLEQPSVSNGKEVHLAIR
jgi:hypothetical protein